MNKRDTAGRRAGTVSDRCAGTVPFRRDGTAAILFDPLAGSQFDLDVAEPTGTFATHVQQYWSVHWNRRDDDPYLARLLPAPCVNVTFKRGRSRVTGVSPAMFTERLTGRDTVFGVRFAPGAFRALLGRPVTGITGRFVPVGDVFGPDASAWERPILAASDVAERVAVFERLFGAHRLAPLAEPALLVRRAVDAVVADRSLLRVADLAGRLDVDVRRLERWFAEYVGVSPKWTIRRYRMQEAAARAGSEDFTGWADLAHDLGYADQAHFARDFRANTGLSPSGYRGRLGADDVAVPVEAAP